jgi:hypothetical protein
VVPGPEEDALAESGIGHLVRGVVVAIGGATATLTGVTTGVVIVGSAATAMTGATATIIGVATRATSERTIFVGA